MTKKVTSEKRRKKVTPSVAAPGDTNPSDATDWHAVFGHVRWLSENYPAHPALSLRVKAISSTSTHGDIHVVDHSIHDFDSCGRQSLIIWKALQPTHRLGHANLRHSQTRTHTERQRERERKSSRTQHTVPSLHGFSRDIKYF